MRSRLSFFPGGALTGPNTDSPIEEDVIQRLLERLASAERGDAWSEFLEQYAPQILQVVHHVEWDAEQRTDCFVFVCEELSRNRFRRLRRFDPTKGASFTTWVQVIAHNLCLDWRRKNAGRFRLFQSLADLSALDEEIYRCAYSRGLSIGETREALRPDYPDLAESDVSETLERIRQQLTPRQHWLLSIRRPKVVPLVEGAGRKEDPSEIQIADPGPDPEDLAADAETRARLGTALAALSDEDRLLVRLRFEQGLTLERAASLTGLNNAQQADRRLQQILAALRDELEGGSG